mmetsp:Transcript_25494/g.53285  ORF Transcript_25494/g.53285 Transcript_25494/m.53285 type:complete len:95 (-) Transcript_25494:477-761(-)
MVVRVRAWILNPWNGGFHSGWCDPSEEGTPDSCARSQQRWVLAAAFFPDQAQAVRTLARTGVGNVLPATKDPAAFRHCAAACDSLERIPCVCFL